MRFLKFIIVSASLFIFVDLTSYGQSFLNFSAPQNTNARQAAQSTAVMSPDAYKAMVNDLGKKYQDDLSQQAAQQLKSTGIPAQPSIPAQTNLPSQTDITNAPPLTNQPLTPSSPTISSQPTTVVTPPSTTQQPTITSTVVPSPPSAQGSTYTGFSTDYGKPKNANINSQPTTTGTGTSTNSGPKGWDIKY